MHLANKNGTETYDIDGGGIKSGNQTSSWHGSKTHHVNKNGTETYNNDGSRIKSAKKPSNWHESVTRHASKNGTETWNVTTTGTMHGNRNRNRS